MLFFPEDGGSRFLRNISNSNYAAAYRNTAAFNFTLHEISAVTPFIMSSSVSVVTRLRAGYSGVRFPAGLRNVSLLRNVNIGCWAAAVDGEADFD